jgi:hypothetical protein
MKSYDVISAIIGAVLLLSVIGSAVFLAYEKIIDGPAIIAILVSIVSLAAGALAVHSGVKAGATAAKTNGS